MQRIIEDLLTLSTLESAAEPPREERVGRRLLLSRIQSEASRLSQGGSGSRWTPSRGRPRGGGIEIASAFGNLASNAVR